MWSGSSCKKFIEVEPPPTSVTTSYVFSSDATAISSMLSIYSKLMQANGLFSGGGGGISTYGSLSSDELDNYSNSAALIEIYTNSLIETNATTSSIWRQAFKCIYDANAVIGGVNNSDKISIKIKKQLIAEAKFVRAFCYFNLVNYYGNVPLLLTTDYRLNSNAPRTNSSEIYRQIILDLKEAQSELPTTYLSQTNAVSEERVRPNKFAATAVLARTYLYIKDYNNAEIQANSIISNTNLYDTTTIAGVFLKNSKEAIWQLQPVLPGSNTFDAPAFVLLAAPSPSSSSGKNAALSDNLVNSFTPGDKRKSAWIGNLTVTGGKTCNYPYKYKVYLSNQPVTEYVMVLRFSEQLLIRAEARIHQNKIPEGISDLNVLRKRARALSTLTVPNPLPDLITSLSKEDALLAVERERRWELFTEWSHRWYDLKRTGRANEVLGPIKGSNWQPTDQLWPIPQSEMGLNPNLKPQNDGY